MGDFGGGSGGVAGVTSVFHVMKNDVKTEITAGDLCILLCSQQL